jgi:ABC-type branched-subunit amino acid transport system substrate-binding protein
VGLVAGASACGDDDDDATDATDAPDATSPPTSPPEETTAATEPPEATTAPTEAPDETTASTEPEVTQTINLGVAWADLSAFVSVNPAYGTGDPEEQALAVLDGWRRDGLLPVNGVDVEFVTAGYSAIDSDQKLAVCQQFGTEGEIFAVIGGRDFGAGAECLATRFQIPVIDTNQAPASVYELTAPYMFTLKPSDTEITTAFGNWAVGNGSLDGKKVAIFWESQFADATNAFKTILADAGVEVVSELESGGQGSVGGDQDTLAAQKFAADGADLVVFLVGSSSMVNFMAAAAEQGYAPEYIDTDWASHLSDVAAGAYDQEQWAGTKALASVTAGDLATGLNEAAESCLSNYEEFSGVTIERTAPEKSGEFTNILITCDLASVFLEGLRLATADGGELTQDSFIAGVEQIQDLRGAYWDTLSFAPDDHTGAATAREIEWDTACPCWTPTGEWGPLSDYLS